MHASVAASTISGATNAIGVSSVACTRSSNWADVGVWSECAVRSYGPGKSFCVLQEDVNQWVFPLIRRCAHNVVSQLFSILSVNLQVGRVLKVRGNLGIRQLIEV